MTITAEDPTFAGNSMTAYDAAGTVLGTQAFAYSGTPGINTPSTRTISAKGIRRVQLAVPIGDYVAYDAIVFTPEGPPTLDVECPPFATRGEEISCKVSLSDATLPYTVTAVTAGVTMSTGATTIAFASPGLKAAGQVYELNGPAVAPTHLTVEATVAYRGQTLSLAKETDFGVLQRSAEQAEYVMTLRPSVDGPGNTTRWPSNAGGTLGLYGARMPDWNEVRTATAASGPNAGLSYVLSIPGLPAASINLTMALFPGDAWYQAHPATPGPLNSYGQTICARSSIDALRLDVERHEGVTMADNSHYGIDQSMYRKWHLAAVLGGLVSATKASPEAIKYEMGQTMQAEWAKEQQYTHSLQVAFDAADTPQIYAKLGCRIILE